MKYYKNVELSKEYQVSLPTIGNWIKDSQSGKKDLELLDSKGRTFIAKTEKNIEKMKHYVSQGFKYKPSTKRVVAKPDPDFVKYLSSRQLIEIKKNLEDRHSIDIKYSYIDGGAQIWDDIYNTNSEGSLSTFNSYTSMNELTLSRLIDLLGDKKVNIIDLGPGNGIPQYEFLRGCEKYNKLNSYVAIDISSTILEITEKNFKSTFPDTPFISQIIDFETNTFEDTVYELRQQYPETVNVFLLFGGTLGNFFDTRNAISNIEKSMMKGDMLYITNRSLSMDRVKEAKYLYEEPLSSLFLFASRAVGLIVESTDLEYTYTDDYKTRELYVCTPNDHSITFEINNREEVVEIPKGTKIKVWHHIMTNLDYIDGMANSFGLELILYSISSDNKFNLTVHRK